MTNSPVERPSDSTAPILLTEGAKKGSMAQSSVKRPSEVDPLELELHFDVYECPHCDGGEAKVTYPDSNQVGWETCDQCNGEGELAVRRSEGDRDD